MMIDDIIHDLSKEDLGLSQFMPGEDEDELETVAHI